MRGVSSMLDPTAILDFCPALDFYFVRCNDSEVWHIRSVGVTPKECLCGQVLMGGTILEAVTSVHVGAVSKECLVLYALQVMSA